MDQLAERLRGGCCQVTTLSRPPDQFVKLTTTRNVLEKVPRFTWRRVSRCAARLLERPPTWTSSSGQNAHSLEVRLRIVQCEGLGYARVDDAQPVAVRPVTQDVG